MKTALDDAIKISVDKVLQRMPVQSSSNTRQDLDQKIAALVSILAVFRQHIEALGHSIKLQATTVYQLDYMERTKPTSASVKQNLEYAINLILREMKRNSPKRFGRKVDALEAAFSAVQREITPRITHLIRCWNSSVPFHRLPTEIIADILYMALKSNMEGSRHEFHPNQRPIFLQTLTLVSSSWAAIVQNTPSLWSFIYAIDSPKFIATALKRSKRHSLTISCRCARNFGAEQAFLTAINAHTHRWRSASIPVTYDGHLLQLPKGAAPMLEDLSLSSRGQEVSKPAVPFGGVAPKLRSFKAYNVYLPWDSTMLLGLEVLDVYIGGESVGPSITQIFTILASSPRLESFKINNTACVDNSSQLNISRPIDLLRLKFLQLMTVPSSFLQQLLSTLRAPSCSGLDITFRDIPTHEVEALSQAVKRSMDHVIPCARLTVAAARAIDLHIDGRDLYFECRMPGMMPRLSVQFGNAGSILVPWLSRLLGDRLLMPQLPVISLHLSPGEFMEDQNFNSILDSFPCIDNLELSTYTRDHGSVLDLLQYLSRPSRNERDEGRILTWPQPRLTGLKFLGGEWPGDALMKMIDARYGDAARRHIDGGAVPPAPLRRLTVLATEQMDATNYEEKLKNVLGRDVVEWCNVDDFDDPNWW